MAEQRGSAGQASVELLAGLPALLLAGLIGFQLLAAGWALTLADNAAEAGALARVAGADPQAAARDALPGWARDRVSVVTDGGRVEVRLRPPSPLPGARRAPAGVVASLGQGAAGAVSGRPAAALVSGHNARGSLALAAALAVEAARGSGAGALLAEVSAAQGRRPTTLLASATARELESALRAGGHEASARGHLCHLPVQPNAAALAELGAAAASVGAGLVVVQLPPDLWRPALEAEALEPRAGVLLVELPRERSLAALAVAELSERGCRAKVATRPPAALAARRALAGVRPGGSLSRRMARVGRGLLGDGGQALPAVLAAAAALIATGLVLVAIGGAVTGKARVQRAADLAALSAARSMHDQLPRLLAPPRLPDGSPNPSHISRGRYLASARRAADEAARRNGVAPERLLLSFPDAESMPPLRARARVVAEIDPRELPGGERLEDPATLRRIPVAATAVAEAALPGGDWTGMPADASGGGYSGPLTYRNGEGMRPDVGRAFDLMAAAARRAGLALVVNSGFRSDAEQARLFAAHPDPTWVAPPGRSLHRCATELDLGPSSAYGWLAAQCPPLRLPAALLMGAVALRVHRWARPLLGGG